MHKTLALTLLCVWLSGNPPGEPMERFDLQHSGIRNLARLHMSDSGSSLALDFASGSHQIVELDSDFRLVSKVGRFGRGPGEYQMPADAGFLNDNELFLLDMGNQKLIHYSRTGRNWISKNEHILPQKERYFIVSATFMNNRFFVLYSDFARSRKVNSFILYSYDKQFHEEELVISVSTDHNIDGTQPHGSNFMRLIAHPPVLILNNNVFNEIHIVNPISKSVTTNRFTLPPPTERMKASGLPSNRRLITLPTVTPAYHWISFEDGYFIYDRLVDDDIREIWFHDLPTGYNGHLLDVPSDEVILTRRSEKLYTLKNKSDGSSFVHLYDLSKSK